MGKGEGTEKGPLIIFAPFLESPDENMLIGADVDAAGDTQFSEPPYRFLLFWTLSLPSDIITTGVSVTVTGTATLAMLQYEKSVSA